MNAVASAATSGSANSLRSCRISLTIIFSKPTARKETAFIIDENAGLSGFHRKGTGASSKWKSILRGCSSVMR